MQTLSSADEGRSLVDTARAQLAKALRVDHGDRVNRVLQAGAATAELRKRESDVSQLAALRNPVVAP